MEFIGDCKKRLNEIEKYFAFLTSTFVKSISALRPKKFKSSKGGRNETKVVGNGSNNY